MKVLLLFASRTHSPDEPELVDCIDEYVHDANPEYLPGRIQELCDDMGPEKEWASYGIVEIQVPETAINNAVGTWVST